jgi:hypothetical protein
VAGPNPTAPVRQNIHNRASKFLPVGLFGKIFGGAGQPPGGAPPYPRALFGAAASGEQYGRKLTSAETDPGPFPKTMRLRAGSSDYDLYGSWQIISWESAEAFAAARDKVLHGYYLQFGMYRLPDGSETIRWNEMTWRAMKEQLQILYDPKFDPSGRAAQ